MMRGKAFHNMIVVEAREIFAHDGWQTFVEYRYRRSNVTTYFDLFATKGNLRLACEIETTARHAVDNVVKACNVGIQVWVVVPTTRVKGQIEQRLRGPHLVTNGFHAEVLLLGLLPEKLANLSGRPPCESNGETFSE